MSKRAVIQPGVGEGSAHGQADGAGAAPDNWLREFQKDFERAVIQPGAGAAPDNWIRARDAMDALLTTVIDIAADAERLRRQAEELYRSLPGCQQAELGGETDLEIDYPEKESNDGIAN